MVYFLAGGGLVAVWTVMLVIAGERQRRLNELEVLQQIAEASSKQASSPSMLPRKKAA